MATYSAPNSTKLLLQAHRHIIAKQNETKSQWQGTVITSTQQKSGSVELMTGPEIHNLSKDINKDTL